MGAINFFASNKKKGDIMCNSKIYSYLIGIIAVIAGIAGGVLFAGGTLTGLAVILPFFAIISAIIFATVAVLILLPKNKEKSLAKCLCEYGKVILFLSLLSIASVLFILSTTLAATSILSIVSVSVAFASLAGAALAFLFLFYCILDRKCNNNNSYCCRVNTQTANTNSCDFELD